ncbi:hypothetical protein BKA69DRAFT_1166485 [Paraphysoderma sedebokerense]|nr:hypothetical protein BKA69DRAFT_1166485 [Paraphysoderma sedebokerense]
MKMKATTLLLLACVVLCTNASNIMKRKRSPTPGLFDCFKGICAGHPPVDEHPTFPHPIPENCDRMVVRKEWRECSKQEKQLFIRALLQLHQRPSRDGDGSSRYDDFVKWHVRASSYAHGEPFFLPWHRFFVYQLEKELQSLGPEFRNVFIPYWRWSLDAVDPAAASVWGDDSLSFGRGGVGFNIEVKTGAFAKWKIRRQWRRDGRMDSWYGEADVKDLIDNFDDYDNFRSYFEGPIHGAIHVNVGGFGGDMAHMVSPKDPIFWLHHSEIDRIWHEWQLRSPRRFKSYNGRYWNINFLKRARPSDDLPGFNVKVEDIFDPQALCYQYKPMNSRLEISNRAVRHYVEPLPDWWISNQGFKSDIIRNAELYFLRQRPAFVIPPLVQAQLQTIDGIRRSTHPPSEGSRHSVADSSPSDVEEVDDNTRHSGEIEEAQNQ